MQFAEGLPDRQAADAVRSRVDAARGITTLEGFLSDLLRTARLRAQDH
jgi:hypothetical protein